MVLIRFGCVAVYYGYKRRWHTKVPQLKLGFNKEMKMGLFAVLLCIFSILYWWVITICGLQTGDSKDSISVVAIASYRPVHSLPRHYVQLTRTSDHTSYMHGASDCIPVSALLLQCFDKCQNHTRFAWQTSQIVTRF